MREVVMEEEGMAEMVEEVAEVGEELEGDWSWGGEEIGVELGGYGEKELCGRWQWIEGEEVW